MPHGIVTEQAAEQAVIGADLKLAQTLTARLCHDLSGVLGTLMGALELSNVDPAMREEALPLAWEAAQVLGARLRFMRAAWTGEKQARDWAAIQSLCSGLSVGRHVQLCLDGIAPDRRLGEHAAPLILNLLALGLECLAGEGALRVSEAGPDTIMVTITGKRAAWPAELAGYLADRQVAMRDSPDLGPRRVLAPLAALVAHDAGMTVLLGTNDPAATASLSLTCMPDR
jgi:hypothetical protein